MQLGNFNVTIPEGVELANGYVKMAHGQQYTISMGNFSDLRCNAYVTVDGLDMGAYRLDQFQTFPLQRSSKDQGRFTFFKVGTQEASAAGESLVNKLEKGVIQVRFVPERRRQPNYGVSKGITRGGFDEGGEEDVLRGSPSPTFGATRGGTRGLGAGMTGLTGSSNQRFQSASYIDEDENETVTITLRLVHQKDDDVRPLPGRKANTPPPPVE